MGRMYALFLLVVAGCDDPTVSAQAAQKSQAADECRQTHQRFEADRIGSADKISLVASRLECFEGNAVAASVAQSTFRKGARQRIAEIITSRERGGNPAALAHDACDQYTAVGTNPKLPFGSGTNRDSIDVLCAYADASDGTATGYLSALTAVAAIRDEELRVEANKDLIAQAYLLHYLGQMQGSFDAFAETYPLADAMPVKDFGLLLVGKLYQHPIPVAFMREQGVDEATRHALLAEHFAAEMKLRGQARAVIDLADAYVAAGYDAHDTYLEAYHWLMGDMEYSAALEVAHRRLGPNEVRLAEQRRIAELEAQGRYSIIVGSDGRHSKIYPMRDE